jgi:toxin ParE1/3/4
MAEFLFTNKAVEDLSRIWNYTFDEWSEKQADTYYNLLLESCRNIAENPDAGKNYDGIKKGILGFKTSHHIIFYRSIKGGPIEVVRILHERMDLKNRMNE